MIPVIGTIVNRLRKAIAIVEDGDTASQTIAQGKYIVWKGELCQTDSAIPQGSTFATSGAGKNLTAKTEGLGGEIATLNSKITAIQNVTLTWADGTANGNNSCYLHDGILFANISWAFDTAKSQGGVGTHNLSLSEVIMFPIMGNNGSWNIIGILSFHTNGNIIYYGSSAVKYIVGTVTAIIR